MKAKDKYSVFRGKVEPALLSKVKEFHLLGYKTVTIDELWSYLVEKVWSRDRGDIHLHKLVADIFAVKIGDYMNFKTVESFRIAEEGPFSISEEERKALFLES